MKSPHAPRKDGLSRGPWDKPWSRTAAGCGWFCKTLEPEVTVHGFGQPREKGECVIRGGSALEADRLMDRAGGK